MLSGKLTYSDYQSISHQAPDFGEEPLDQEQFRQVMGKMDILLSGASLPRAAIADLAVSNMRLTVEGDDSVGYDVIIESPGAATQHAYLVRTGSSLKVLGFSSDSSDATEAAPAALQALAENNLAAAQKWLDRARDRIRMAGSDDPVAFSPLPDFNGPGAVNASTMRTAALVLMQPKALKGHLWPVWLPPAMAPRPTPNEIA